MAIRRARHGAYDIKYLFVWILKYRKHILTKQLKNSTEGLFRATAEQYDFEINTMGIKVDYVHIFLLPHLGILLLKL
jgi:REP element-mobilizing transposase RayT